MICKLTHNMKALTVLLLIGLFSTFSLQLRAQDTCTANVSCEGIGYAQCLDSYESDGTPGETIECDRIFGRDGAVGGGVRTGGVRWEVLVCALGLLFAVNAILGR